MATATRSKQASPAKNQPAKEFRSGNIRAVIWLNETDNGRWYSVNITRSYKTSDNTWKETSQFNRDDLLTVAKLSELAFHFIADQN